MSDRPQSPIGRHLLDRRGFLGHMASGMGGVALAAMLAEQGLLADEAADTKKGLQASLATLNPVAPRPPHFPGRARRVLHIFCTGAVSHLDTWDYKPELDQAARPADAGRREADHLPGRERQPGAAPGSSAREASRGSTSRTCCRTWPPAPTTCASSIR